MLCFAEFLDFGPEILTRDLNQAQKNSGSRMQKKYIYIDALFPTSSFSRNFGPAIGGQFVFCFFASDFQCVAELVSNHVSKYQVQTPKIGRDIAILSRSGPLARPSSYSTPIISNRKRYSTPTTWTRKTYSTPFTSTRKRYSTPIVSTRKRCSTQLFRPERGTVPRLFRPERGKVPHYFDRKRYSTPLF